MSNLIKDLGDGWTIEKGEHDEVVLLCDGDAMVWMDNDDSFQTRPTGRLSGLNIPRQHVVALMKIFEMRRKYLPIQAGMRRQ